MPSIFYLPRQVPLSATGDLLSGAKLYTYLTGTSTPYAAYTDYALTTPHANPIVADSNGVFPTIFFGNTQRYRVTLKTSADVTLYTQDDVGGVAMNQSEIGQVLYPQTVAESNAGVTPTNYYKPPGYIKRYGAAGNGSTDDTSAFISAASVMSSAGGGRIYLEAGTYKVGAVGDIPYGTKFIGEGPQVSIIKKATAGTCFTVKAFYVEFQNLSFDSDYATSATYATNGQMIDYATGFSSSDGRLLNVNSVNIDTVIRFAGDAGARHQVIGGYWIPYTTTSGSEGSVYKTGATADDSSAMFRTVVGLTSDGQIDVSGSVDTDICGVSCRRMITTSTTKLLSVTGGIWGSLGVAVTITGQNVRIMGVRISGNITLANTMSGACAFIGNIQTTGTFTDSSPAQCCMVMHHPLSSGYVNLNKFTLSQSANAEEIVSFRIGANSGNADTTLTLDQSQTCVMYNTAITADRAVNLPASGRDGKVFRVVRQANATGAFNVNVKTNGGTTLKALGAASTWCDVAYSGPAADYVLIAAGSL